MGTQFSMIYDLVLAAILLGMMLSGMKRGFASALVGLLALFVAFTCALLLSGPITDAIYTSYVRPPVDKAMDEVVDEVLDTVTLAQLSDLDYSTITINGTPAEDKIPEYSSTNIKTYDLSKVDLSNTGIAELDLSAFGFDEDTDYSALSGKTAEFTATDLERYGLEKLIVAQIITVSALNTDFYESFVEFTDKIGEAVPVFFGDMAEKINRGDNGAVRSIVLIMMTSGDTAKDAVVNGIIEPCFTIAVESLLFCFIFISVSIVLSVIAKVLKFVNKIPVIGGINVFGGAIVGLVQGLLTVFVVCIVVRVIIILGGGNIMFFNNAAIDATYLFKIFYNYEFLNFIK